MGSDSMKLDNLMSNNKGSDNSTSDISELYRLLAETYPRKRPLLDYRSPYQLLISVILSAQTTDKQVNSVSPGLFSRFPGPEELAVADIGEVEEIIRSTGFFSMKAKHIIGTANELLKSFGGRVPGTMEELLRLPGVGRKSANVVLAHCFGRPAIIVDTHFARVTRRLGLVESKDPKKIESLLGERIPEEIQTDFSMYINYLGRDWCHAKKPDCPACPLRFHCPSAIME